MNLGIYEITSEDPIADKQMQIIGSILVHVDDFVFAGDETTPSARRPSKPFEASTTGVRGKRATSHSVESTSSRTNRAYS